MIIIASQSMCCVTIKSAPITFPVYERVQFFTSSFKVAFFSATAATKKTVLPVNNSPPHTRVIISPVESSVGINL